MYRFKEYIIILVILSVSAFLTGCGGGTEIGPEGGYRIGTIYNEDGTTASDVSVRFIKRDEPLMSNLGKIISNDEHITEYLTVTTNRNGEIILEDIVLDDGIYQMLAEKGTLKSFTDSIQIDDGAVEEPVTDTLKKTGALTGRVCLQYGYNPCRVQIFVYGAREMYAVDDTTGRFTINNIAEGEYMVRFYPGYEDYNTLDTRITIRSNAHDTLSEEIEMPLSDAIIRNFSFKMDMDMRAVTFFWDRIDTGLIGGYKFEWKEGVSVSTEMIYFDTSKTVYLNNAIDARVGAVSKNGDNLIGNYTPYITVHAIDSLKIKTIALPVDTVRAIGMAYANDNFNVLRVNRDDPRSGGIYIGVCSRTGQWLEEYALDTGVVKEPVAIAAFQDTLYILDRINYDTLCVKRVILDDTQITCDIKCSIPNFGVGCNLDFGSNGEIIIGQYQTTYVMDSEGAIQSKKGGIAAQFAVNGELLYTGQKYEPTKIVKYKLTPDRELDSINEYTLDPYNVITDVSLRPKLLTVNSSKIVCCLLNASLFIFNEEYKDTSGMSEEDKASVKNQVKNQRLYIENEVAVVDMHLMNDNTLYMLDQRCRIDVVRIDGAIIDKP